MNKAPGELLSFNKLHLQPIHSSPEQALIGGSADLASGGPDGML